MELKELKAFKNGTIPTEQPSILDKMVPAGEVLGSTVGKSTLADRKAIHNLPKFGNGKGNPFANAALNVMGNILQNHSNIFKTIGSALGGAAKAIGGAIGGAIGNISNFSEKPNKTFGTNGNAMLSAATGAIGLTTGIIDAHQFNTTADDALQDAGTSEGNIGGVTYERLNAVNASQISEQTSAENKVNTIGLMGNGAVTGAAIGSIIPGGTLLGGAIGAIGGLVGGLFGAGSRKEKMERMLREARDKAYRKNDYARSGALTSAMQQQYAQQYGDTESQSLYGFVNGKQSFSAAGPTNGYNARVSNGEIIANKFTGEMFRVPGIPNNKDGKLAYIRPSDTVISNKYGLSDYVALTGDLEGGEAMQGTIMKALGKKGYKNGKLPGYKFGLEEINAIGNLGLGALSMFDSYNKRREPVKNSNTYSNNVYENVALNEMNNLRVNPYPIMPQIYDTMAKGMYAIENAGGLGGGLRNLARLAAITDANNNIAKLLSAMQEKNNDYRQGWAQAALTAGSDDARRRMQANQWDLDYYSKAHGAREKMADQRRADALTFFQSYLKGVNDISMFNKQMDAWWADYYANHPEKDPNKKQITPGTSIVSNSKTHKANILPNPMRMLYDTANKPKDEFRYKIPKVLSNSYLNNLYKLDPALINYLSNYGIR